MTKIAVLGANGRMGRVLIKATLDDENTNLSVACVRNDSKLLGVDAGNLVGRHPCGVELSAMEEMAKQLTDVDVAIDFTLPETLEAHLQWGVEYNIPLVLGTTGLNDQQLRLIDKTASQIPIVFAVNYSVGVNLMLNLAKTTAAVMGNYSDIEIIEAHHRFKKDAPSGTAMKLGKVIADELGRDLNQCAVYGRSGQGIEREREIIGFSTIRAADIVGEHTVMFADMGERLELTHRASSRSPYAKGAIRAAKWLEGKPAGLYNMQMVLGLDG